VRPLDKLNSPEPKTWPRVSIIIPACNEAKTLEKALRSKLDSDYPNFEIIVINDRSTDSTGEILARLSQMDKRIKAVQVHELPEGWLGKPHALARAVEVADGDWYLFTDADVHFSKDAMRKTVAYCEDRKIDQLGVIPYVWTNKFFLNVVLLTYIRSFSQLAGFWGLFRPRTNAFSGVGAFNLVRRTAYEKTEGFEWLRLEIVDDVALGWMIQRSGGQVSIVNGNQDLRVEWYTGIREMTVGMEKGTFSAWGNFSLRRTMFWTSLFLLFEMAPIMAMLTLDMPYLQILGAITWVIGLLISIRITTWANGPFLPTLVFPLGTLIFCWMLLRAGWMGWRRDGIMWRGTYYSGDELKNGKRFSLP
jgi:glycosyltransferase involved in cell wall biosynthesis